MIPRWDGGAALAAIVAAILASMSVPARAAGDDTPQDLGHASLEELMAMEVTSATRTHERAEDVPAAIYVITAEDIRRSGITSVPELFRLVPGMQVARIDGNKWAIAVRGFNDLFSNKLLVLIDGRPIYNRAFSGVFWEDVALAPDDIDRIEVVRGPGGALWGANAVNGVINIVTKDARDTRGGAVSAGSGTFDRSQLWARYGSAVGPVAWRISSRWTDTAATKTPSAARGDDAWRMFQTALRGDWSSGPDQVTFHAETVAGSGRSPWLRIDAPDPSARHVGDDTTLDSAVVMAAWTHEFVRGGSLKAQMFWTRWNRVDGAVLDREHNVGTDLQYTHPIGRHTLVSGMEIRDVTGRFDGTFTVSSVTPRFSAGADGLFAQDSYRVSDTLRVFAGVKLEHDDDAGWNTQPTLRALWDSGHHHVWAAVSRSVRTPSVLERTEQINVAVVPTGGAPAVIRLLGNPDLKPETLRLVEGGYRAEVASAITVDATIYAGRYDQLTTQEPVAPVFETAPLPPHVVVATRAANGLSASTSGFEVAVRWSPRSSWRMDASYAAFRLTPRPAAGVDAPAPTYDGNAPAHAWQLHAFTSLTRRLEADGALFFTGRLREFGTPAYVRADARAEFRLTSSLSLVAVGQNLLSGGHAEYTDPHPVVVTTDIPRSASVQLAWRQR